MTMPVPAGPPADAGLPAEADVVVVGAGLLGLATARALTGRGREVLVLERAWPGHPGAGSTGSCRIFRLGYPDPEYVRAAIRARELWHELEAESGRGILLPAPQLTSGPEMPAVRDALAAAGVPGDLLSEEEVADRFPGVRPGGPALLEPASAVTRADAALAALAAAIHPVRSGVTVTSLADDGRRVRLTIAAEGETRTMTARVVVVCAGARTAGLLGPAIPLPARATLEQAVYLAAAPGCAPAGSLPIFLRYEDHAPYGLPVPGESLYKLGVHPSGTVKNPLDQHSQEPDPDLSALLAATARRHLPGLSPHPVRIERCEYDSSPDADFILDRAGNVVVGCGTSGHGFKFGPLLGEWLAALATGDESACPPSRFGLARFR